MNKRILSAILILTLLFTLTACGDTTVTSPEISSSNAITEAASSSTSTKEPTPTQLPMATEAPTSTPTPTDIPTQLPIKEEPSPIPEVSTPTLSVDSLEAIAESKVTATIEELVSNWDQLTADIDTYEKYIDNIETVKNFYLTIEDKTLALCINLMELSADYADDIINSGKDRKEMRKESEVIYDAVYNDALDELYDEIYNDLLKNMYDYFYDGLVKDSYEYISYSQYTELRSDEYDFYSDARSNVYDYYSDTRSSIYNFYSDFKNAVSDERLDTAVKKLSKFLQLIEKQKNPTCPEIVASFDYTIVTTTDTIEETMEELVQNRLTSIYDNWTEVSTKINTYSKYTTNPETIEDFYENLIMDSKNLCLELSLYGIAYTNTILASADSTADKCAILEDVCEIIYEDSFDEIKDNIYDDLLEEISDYYYNGIIEDEQDNVPYSEWLNTYSDEYERWLEAGSDIYNDWLNINSDFYSFCINIQGALMANDTDGAYEELSDFQNKLARY